jgi:hypothetical protein
MNFPEAPAAAAAAKAVAATAAVVDVATNLNTQAPPNLSIGLVRCCRQG